MAAIERWPLTQVSLYMHTSNMTNLITALINFVLLISMTNIQLYIPDAVGEVIER